MLSRKANLVRCPHTRVNRCAISISNSLSSRLFAHICCFNSCTDEASGCAVRNRKSEIVAWLNLVFWGFFPFFSHIYVLERYMFSSENTHIGS